MRTMSLRPCHRRCRAVHRDRAAIVANTLMLVIDTAPEAYLRQEIERVLRIEFEDERRQAIAD